MQNPAERPRRGEDDVRVEEKTVEDEVRTGGRPEREDVETGERRCGGPTEEWSYPEQLTPGENLDGEQGSPETQRLRHVPGGAWLQQVRSCLQSRLNALVGKEEGERGRKGGEGGKGRKGRKGTERKQLA
ncbi:hypothetical protein NDU88_000973 [Pleurodeles waltl]|uniref:Uncharacterized protein n=1 Tax=Pleurodeles waltl TaxID=8319 RepID=A0AAV7L8B9_PLEWA|nr:hypothetical protein NDU88_000973 [Pleurodeles waltl]